MTEGPLPVKKELSPEQGLTCALVVIFFLAMVISWQWDWTFMCGVFGFLCGSFFMMLADPELDKRGTRE